MGAGKQVIILSTEEGDGIAENVNSPGVLCEEVETGLTLIEKSKKRWVCKGLVSCQGRLFDSNRESD